MGAGHDGAVGTDDDITAFFDAIAGTGPSTYPVSLSDNRFGFRGYWWDDHLKLYHVRNRVYDPATFRWLQPDPAGYVDGLNLYGYKGEHSWARTEHRALPRLGGANK